MLESVTINYHLEIGMHHDTINREGDRPFFAKQLQIEIWQFKPICVSASYSSLLFVVAKLLQPSPTTTLLYLIAAVSQQVSLLAPHRQLTRSATVLAISISYSTNHINNKLFLRLISLYAYLCLCCLSIPVWRCSKERWQRTKHMGYLRSHVSRSFISSLSRLHFNRKFPNACKAALKDQHETACISPKCDLQLSNNYRSMHAKWIFIILYCNKLY